MTTKTKSLSIEKLATIVKPFVGSLKWKNVPMAILKTALITNEYIIATDSHRLIRIKHHQEVNEPYLYHFKKELTQDCSVTSYPDVSRLLPDTRNSQQEIKINIAEWLEAHELGLIAAKEQGKNKAIKLQNNQFTVNEEMKSEDRMYSDDKRYFDDIAFKYILDTDTKISEKVAYNCEYMLEALKAMKKLGEKESTLYFYNRTRPMYFIAGDVEILILPVRSY